MKNRLILLILLAIVSLLQAQPQLAWCIIDTTTQLWEIRPTSKVAVDDDGNILWGGFVFYKNSRKTDVAVCKYGPNGHQLWKSVFTNFDHPHDGGHIIRFGFGVNHQGSAVFSTEVCQDEIGGTDILTGQYGPNGRLQWSRFFYYSDKYDMNDDFGDMVMDDKGHVYITGRSQEPDNLNWFLCTVGYCSNGDTCSIGYLTDLYPSDVKKYSMMGLAITLDSKGNKIIAGEANAQDWGTIDDILVVGNNWHHTWGLHEEDEIGVDVAVDSADNVIVLGVDPVWADYNFGSDFFLRGHFILLKYAANGVFSWSKYKIFGDSAFNGNGLYIDKKPETVAVDSHNNIIITGYIKDATYRYSLALAKFDSAGNELWRRYYSSTVGNSDIPKRLFLDSLDNIYVIGQSCIADSVIIKTSAAVWKYSPDGELIWKVENHSEKGHQECVRDGYIDKQGNIYILAHLKDYSSKYSHDLMLLKYSGAFTDVPKAKPQPPLSFNLYQNYPNPFNPKTTIAFSLSRAEQINLSIFNVSGRKVRELMNGRMKAGQHKMIWDGTKQNGRPVSSGLYFYRLQAGDKQLTRKMLLVR